MELTGLLLGRAREPIVSATIEFFVKAPGAPAIRVGGPVRTDLHGRFALSLAGSPPRLLEARVKEGRRSLGSYNITLTEEAREIEISIDDSQSGPTPIVDELIAVGSAIRDAGGDESQFSKLMEADLASVSVVSGVAPQRISTLQRLKRLEEETGVSILVFEALHDRLGVERLDTVLGIDLQTRARIVEAAIKAGSIPRSEVAAIREGLSRLEELGSRRTLDESDPNRPSTLGRLMRTVRLTNSQQDAVLREYISHKGSMPSFWAKMRGPEVPDLTEEEVERVQLSLQLNLLTRNHVPLVRELLQRYRPTSPRDLASLDRQTWITLTERVGVPPVFDGPDIDPADYAEALYLTMEDAYPTAMLAANLEGIDDDGSLAGFFARHPEYELRSTPIKEWLADHPDHEADPSDPGNALVKRLRALRRTLNVAPPGHRVAVLTQLVADGVDSAQKIRAIGRPAFIRRYEASLGVDVAKSVYSRASSVTALATASLAQYGGSSRALSSVLCPSRSQFKPISPTGRRCLAQSPPARVTTVSLSTVHRLTWSMCSPG